MPLLNFQKQFAEAVKNGDKRQTIRAKRKRPIRVNDTLYLYTGLRTKNARLLGKRVCKEVDKIFITPSGICVGFEWLFSFDLLDTFAIEDGFEDWTDMIYWFHKTHGLPFEGDLIKW